MFSLNLNKVLIVLFNAFLLIISLDPTGRVLGVKEILFVILLFLAFIILIEKHVSLPKSCLAILLFCLATPVWGIVIAILQDNLSDWVYAFGQLKSFLFILIFLFLINLDFDDILKALFFSGTLIAICSVIIFIIAQINVDLFRLIYNQSTENSNIIISERSYYGFSVLGVYFKTGPFILFSYIYSLYFYPNSSLRKVFVSLNLFALLIAGSRTPMLMSILITVIYIHDKQRIGYFLKFIFLCICIGGITYITYKLATERGETSNDIKLGDFSSYLQTISSNLTLLIGDGLGSVFYAAGRGEFVSNTEQTYMDIIRIYGLLVGGILISAVYYPLIFFMCDKIRDVLKYQRFIMAYVLYMILAGTNPLLISSTGMLIWAVGLTFVYKVKKNQLRCV